MRSITRIGIAAFGIGSLGCTGLWSSVEAGLAGRVPPKIPVDAPPSAEPAAPAEPAPLEPWEDLPPAVPPPPSDGAADARPWEPPAEPCGRVEAGVYEVRFPFAGSTQRSVLVVPAGEGPRELVLALHGGGGNPAKVLKQSRFDTKAQREGFVVLAPAAADLAGHGPRWNTGKFDHLIGDDVGRDDLAYLEGLVRQVKEQLCVKRVLAVGFSNGGQMAHRFACETDQADAILTAAGSLITDPASCKGPRPLRAYIGTEDKIYDGPPAPGTEQPSAPQTAALWAGINRCDLTAEPRVEERDGARCTHWRGCAAPTTLCVIEGFPHAWPAPWTKKSATRVDMTDDGWAWFQAVR